MDDVADTIPDLCRLKAEIYLAQAEAAGPEPDEELLAAALDSCRLALEHKKSNFMAHHVLARCHLARKNAPTALESADRALSIFPRFKEAEELRLTIESMQEAGGGSKGLTPRSNGRQPRARQEADRAVRSISPSSARRALPESMDSAAAPTPSTTELALPPT